MKGFVSTFLLLLIVFYTGQAQNLIPNPSFEKHLISKELLYEKAGFPLDKLGKPSSSLIKSWKTTKGGGHINVWDNYFKFDPAPFKANFGKVRVVPSQKTKNLGSHPAQEGYMMVELGNNFFLYTPLNKALVKGKRYRLTYHLRRRWAANPFLKALYMHIALAKEETDFNTEKEQKEIITIPYEKLPVQETPLRAFGEDTIVTIAPKPEYWQRFETEFIATDTFNYLAFARQVNEERGKQENFHIDNIQLHCLDCPAEEQTEALDKLARQVQFETGKAVLTSDAKLSIELAIPELQKFMDETSFLLMEGHTDNIGSRKDNLKLSQARADAIKAFLVEKGIPATQIITKGYGDKEPIADNATKEGRAKNRRVELELIYPETAQSVIFEPLTWEQALEKSKRTGKPIFLDAVTSWCKPCKKMDRDVFTDSAVATFFNANFINLKFDMEAEESKAVKEKYKVGVYPTLLFVDEGGEVIYRETGYANSDELLTISEAVTSELKGAEERKMEIYQSPRRSYFDDPCDTEKAHAFFKQLDGEEDPAKLQDFERLKDAYLECMKTQQTYSREEAEFVLGILSRTPRDPVYRFFQKHRDKFEANYGDSLLAYEGYTEEVFFFNRIDSLRSHEEVNYKQLEQICADYQAFSDRLEKDAKRKGYNRYITDGFVKDKIVISSFHYAQLHNDNRKSFEYILHYFAPSKIPDLYKDPWFAGSTSMVQSYLHVTKMYLKDKETHSDTFTEQFLGVWWVLEQLEAIPPGMQAEVTKLVKKLEKL